MTSERKRKLRVCAGTAVLLKRRSIFEGERRQWDQMAPVGREFGSPDFERLMEEDRQQDAGVFDPALKDLFSSAA